MSKSPTKGISTLLGILIIIVIASIVSGVLLYQYWWLPKEEKTTLKEETSQEAKTPEKDMCAEDELIEKLRQSTLQGPYGKMPIEDVFAEYLATGMPDHRKDLTLAMLFRKDEILPHLIAKIESELSEWELGDIVGLIQCTRWTEMLPAFVKLMRDEHRPEQIRANAAFALGILGDNRATEALIEFLDTETGSDAKRAVLLALYQLKDPSSAPKIRPYLNHEDTRDRVYAATALAVMGDRQGVNIIIEAVQSEDIDIRDEAITPLVIVGGPEAIKTLEELVASAELAGFKRRAEIALEKARALSLPREELIEYLRERLNDPRMEMWGWAMAKLLYDFGEEGRNVFRATLQEPSQSAIAMNIGYLYYDYVCAVCGR